MLIIEDKKKGLIVKQIKKQVDEGEKSITNLQLSMKSDDLQNIFEVWKSNTTKILKEIFSEEKVYNEFLFEIDCHPNTLSKRETIKILHRGIEKGIKFLQILLKDISEGFYDKSDIEPVDKYNSIDKSTALIIIRRILKNFYKYIQAMYQDKVHGNGTIRKEDLEKIKIGNEYDVQRILYALLRPIFPCVRLEVHDDAGYNSIRYDVVIDEYDVVIEVKCSRKNMKERKLTEELGADAFHYKADYLFFFIYDKDNIIKNVDVFTKNYKREKEDFGKNIEAIVNHPVNI